MTKHIGNLKYAIGAKASKKRVGRGPGSGHGKTATRGYNGQKSRAGASIRPGFEGGQMPINRRLPKFGFNNRFRVDYQEVNIGYIQKLIDGNIIPNTVKEINAELLFNLGVLRKKNLPYKILGDGELNIAINVVADAFTKTAQTKIQSVGGSVKING